VAAIDRMLRALSEYEIGGIRTNLALFRAILEDADFRAACIDTGYLERLLAAQPQLRAEGSAEPPEEIVAIAAALLVTGRSANSRTSQPVPVASSKWAGAGRREGLRS
jgi:acetyl-CoA carboxylase biotin carboxylase subunit